MCVCAHWLGNIIINHPEASNLITRRAFLIYAFDFSGASSFLLLRIVEAQDASLRMGWVVHGTRN